MDTNYNGNITRRSQELFNENLLRITTLTDHMFAGLMAAQWLFGIAIAYRVSPRAWAGTASQIHLHVYAAFILGGIIAALPIFLVLTRPGSVVTRHVVAIGQMLTSALLIHLTGGRIETHFHVFGSLAFLAFYRDWRVIMTATTIVALDHGLRGIYWPESVYGVSAIQSWRFLEHTAWVVFEDAFLCFSIRDSIGEMKAIANRQAQLEETNKHIERKVIKRTAELAEKIKELARSNADLEQFAYAASHDLQEPLRKITSFTQLLSKRYRSRLDADADRFIQHAVDGASRMAAMIQSLLQYSRVGNGQDLLEQTDIGALLKQVLADLDLRIRESSAIVTHDDPMPIILANPLQMILVLQNLIANALKFRGKKPPRIHVAAKQTEGEWIFSVQDNGIGIDPKQANQLFTMFKRLHSGSEYPGTGIGLAICKKIVERHGGRIWIKSQPERGATFFFSVPARKEDHANDPVHQYIASGG